MTRRYALVIAVVVIFLLAISWPRQAPSQQRGSREKLYGLLSRSHLKPPLRGHVRLRYSPDGRFLLAQTTSGLYLLRRQPLSIVIYVQTARMYPAQFSPDSASVMLVSYGLTLLRLNSADGKQIEKRELPVRTCLQFELSPDGTSFACIEPNFNLAIHAISTGELLYSGAVESAQPATRVVTIPLWTESAFSSPLGFVLSNTYQPLSNRGLEVMALKFTPDSAHLFVAWRQDGFRLEVATRKRSSIPGNLQKNLHAKSFFQDNDRLLAITLETRAQAKIVSAKSGDVLSTPSLTADSFSMATDTRYALLQTLDGPGTTVFDLVENRGVRTPDNLSADVRAGELASLDENGEVFIYRLGEILPIATVHLPIDRLPPLTAAALDSDLTHVALSVRGQGSLFQLPGGRRLFTFAHLSAPSLADPASIFFLRPARFNEPREIVRQDIATGKNAPAWASPKERLLFSGGAALLDYSFENSLDRRIMLVTEDGVPFRLRGLDPTKGKELWSRVFDRRPPIPFADPQGDCMVLGWNAKASAAEDAAHKYPEVWQVFKGSKVSKQDTLFEAVNIRSGKSIGAALVQAGSGAASYDSAFAVGDILFLVKDQRRVSLYSLKDSRLLARLVGEIPSASVAAKTFVVADEFGHLTVYDLETAEKVNELLFDEPIAYTHFSGDGKRLFVLSQYQEAFLFDVEKLRQKSASSAPS